MITLTKNGNAVKFQFEDSQHYLMGDGEIQVPVNSLSLIIDESEFVTFKKASSDDIFVSFDPADSNLSTKAGVIQFYKENMVGSTGGGSGSGVTSGEVQTMIDTSLEDYPTNEDLEDALEDYYDKDEVDAGFASIQDEIDEKEEVISTSLNDLNDRVEDKADESDLEALNSSLTAHTANTDIHTTSVEKAAWNAKQTALTAGTGIDITNNVISVTASTGGSNVIELTQAQYEALVDKDPDAMYVITDAPEINISGKADTSAVTAVNDALTAHTANTSIHTTAQEKSTWNGKQDALVSGTNIKTINNQSILGSGNIDIQGGGTDTGTVQTMIEDYCDPKEEVIATALNDLNDRVEAKQDTLVAGDNITISGNVISASGGGGITIDPTLDTGSTNPVANSAITTAINAKQDKIPSSVSTVVTNITHASSDKKALSIEKKRLSNGNSSYTTLDMARINGNGIVSVTTDFQLVEKSSITSAMTSGSTDSQVPSAKCVYDALGGLKFVKLTQSEYENLPTKDSNTLYIVTNVVS